VKKNKYPTLKWEILKQHPQTGLSEANMFDRMTKVLLALIAIALWAQILKPLFDKCQPRETQGYRHP
jgi:hypothetical protein